MCPAATPAPTPPTASAPSCQLAALLLLLLPPIVVVVVQARAQLSVGQLSCKA